MLPKKISLYGVDIPIYCLAKLKDRSETDGYFCPVENAIYIKDNGQEQHMLRTLIHEIFHVTAYYGYGSQLESSADEILATACEYTYYELFKVLNKGRKN